MKKKQKQQLRIYLADIRDELMTINPDPDPNGAFECAFDWWKWRCTRNKWRTHQFFYAAFKRGWLAPSDAESLCLFLNQNHFWRCLTRF